MTDWTPAATGSDAIKEMYMKYWNKLGERGPLSVYLRDWLETPEWVWQKAKALEEEIVELKKEKAATLKTFNRIAKDMMEVTGYDDDYYDRRDW